MLPNPALDPVGNIPEFTYCAVKVTAGGEASMVMGYSGNDVLEAEEKAR